MGFRSTITRIFTVTFFFLHLCWLLTGSANADGIVSQVVSAPVSANGILRDERSALNIYLQSDDVRGLDFMDPRVLGYGIPAGGKMEVEMVSGFQRDPAIPLDDKSLLLVVGAPQQGLFDELSNHRIFEGDNPNTFIVQPTVPEGLVPQTLASTVKGATLDPIPQRGIKIIHVGRVSPFISRGDKGVVEVRIKDSAGRVVASGREEIDFLIEPIRQIFLTNIPHDQRNHNWQRVSPGQVVGAADKTLPLALLLFDRNDGLGKKGLSGSGVLSKAQLVSANVKLPGSLGSNFAGFIFRDSNGDKKLDPFQDEVIGIVNENAPDGAKGQQILTPLVNNGPFLSVDTGQYNPRAGKTVGGSIMQLVYIAGDQPGIYRLSFSMFVVPGDILSARSEPAVYTVVVE